MRAGQYWIARLGPPPNSNDISDAIDRYIETQFPHPAYDAVPATSVFIAKRHSANAAPVDGANFGKLVDALE
jgi:hypothetical protein